MHCVLHVCFEFITILKQNARGHTPPSPHTHTHKHSYMHTNTQDIIDVLWGLAGRNLSPVYSVPCLRSNNTKPSGQSSGDSLHS